MWALLFASLGAAQVPVGLEGGLGLAFPHSRLGPALGIRALGEVAIVDNVWVGGELDARTPGAAKIDLEGNNVSDTVEIRTGQTAWSLGARGSWTPGDPDGLRARLGGAIGATRLIQSIKTDAGTTREAASSLWFRPEAGGVFAIGPGYLTGSLYWSLSPTRIDTLGGTGSVVGLMFGYRAEL